MKLAFAHGHSVDVSNDSKETASLPERKMRPRNPMMDKLIKCLATSDAFSYEVASVVIQEAVEHTKKR